MERLFARLERRLGRYAVPNLIGLIVGGMAIVWVLSLLKPGFQARLALDIASVRRGEVWRLITFLFIPPALSPVWLFISLYFTWWIGSALQENWGAFKFNAYYVVGAIGTVLAALVGGVATNVWLGSSLLLAFATVFPNVQILLFFVIPVRVKWLGVVSALFVAYSAVIGRWDERAAIAACVANYVLFFGAHWVAFFKNRRTLGQQRERLESMRPGAPSRGSDPKGDDLPVFGRRVCAVCGAEEADGADIRVCSCDKCGGQQRALCLHHARNH